MQQLGSKVRTLRTSSEGKQYKGDGTGVLQLLELVHVQQHMRYAASF